MHNFKKGDLALFSDNDKIFFDELVQITSSYELADTRCCRTGRERSGVYGYNIEVGDGEDYFAFKEELKPLPKSSSWENIKAEIFKPKSIIEG